MKRIEKAITYFEEAIKESDEIIAEYSLELQRELTKQKGHFEIALEAMKKQVPQKISKYKKLNKTSCPECGFVFGSYDCNEKFKRYCYNCGQKLDWGSEVGHNA